MPTAKYASLPLMHCNVKNYVFCGLYKVVKSRLEFLIMWKHGGATQPLPRDGGMEELYRGPTVGPLSKVWTRGKNGRRGAEDGAPEKL